MTEGGQDSDITLTNAYRVPQLEENLLSVAAVDRAGGAVIFMGGKCYVYQAAADIEAAGLTEHAGAVGTLSPKWQYMLGRFSNKEEKANTVSAPVKGTAVLHHRRYQHLGYDNLRRLPGMVKGNDVNYLKLEREAGSVCRPCAEGKLTRARFAPSNTAADLMKVVHSDVCGPFPLSIGEAWYFITLYEKKTGLIMAVPMARKSDVGMGLRTNIPTQERLGGKRCQRLRTDGAREYKTSRLLEWYAEGHHPRGDAALQPREKRGGRAVQPPYKGASQGGAGRGKGLRCPLGGGGGGIRLYHQTIAPYGARRDAVGGAYGQAPGCVKPPRLGEQGLRTHAGKEAGEAGAKDRRGRHGWLRSIRRGVSHPHAGREAVCRAAGRRHGRDVGGEPDKGRARALVGRALRNYRRQAGTPGQQGTTSTRAGGGIIGLQQCKRGD